MTTQLIRPRERGHCGRELRDQCTASKGCVCGQRLREQLRSAGEKPPT